MGLHTQLHNIVCPYCGEPVNIIVDYSVAEQNYVEDCHVCCQPINLLIKIGYPDELERLEATRLQD